MTTIDMQTVIARLCVDEGFMQLFIEDLQRALKTFDLSDQEILNLKSLDVEAIKNYSKSLVNKRAGLMKKWFHLTFAFLETSFGRQESLNILHSYIRNNVRDTDNLGGDLVRTEFENFYNFIKTKYSDLKGFPDVIEFEYTHFSMTHIPDLSQAAEEFNQKVTDSNLIFTQDFQAHYCPILGSHIKIKHFRYNVYELFKQLEKQHDLPELKKEENHLLFFRKLDRLEINLINSGLKDFLDRCTGASTIIELVTYMDSKYSSSLKASKEEITNDCLSLLNKLYLESAIKFEPNGKTL